MHIAWTLGSVLLVSLISLIGVVTLGIKKRILEESLLVLVALAAGTLIGDALIHLLPEHIESFGFTARTGIIVLAGVLALFILERFLHWHHCHQPHKHGHENTLGVSILIGDGLHNLLDGALIAASYLVSVPVGIATTIAVLLHEIPQEIADFGVLLHAGFSRSKALLLNFASALTALIGAAAVLVSTTILESLEQYLVPFTAGAFIYIALADLLPELRHEEGTGKMLVHFGAFILGVLLMAGLLLLE